MHTILIGDAREQLATLPDASVQTCVTSPPYWNLRDYGHPDQIGNEPTPEQYVENLVAVFREARRVLKDDGTLFLNLGDAYWGTGKGPTPPTGFHGANGTPYPTRGVYSHHEIKGKDLIGIPWMVAFALRADGWWLRQCNIWHKPSTMPESVRDRTTTAHEYIFHLSKSATYYYDAAAISEPVAASTIERLSQPTLATQAGSERVPGKTNGPMKAVRGSHKGSTFHRGKTATHQQGRASTTDRIEGDRRNKRSVWSIATRGYKGAHFAVFPPEIPETCIKAGSREGDTVLDPFAGSGTTGEVAERLNRAVVLVELNPEYRPLIEQRLAQRPLWDAMGVMA